MLGSAQYRVKCAIRRSLRSASGHSALEGLILVHMSATVPPTRPTRERVAIDDVDRSILRALSADGRLSMRSLADQVHVSRAGVYARVSRLEEAGVITGYSAVLDPVKVGHGVSAYVYLRIAQHSWKAVRARIAEIEEVEHAALISGDDDLVLLVRAADAAALRDLVLNRFQAMPDVLSTKTTLILDEIPHS